MNWALAPVGWQEGKIKAIRGLVCPQNCGARSGCEAGAGGRTAAENLVIATQLGDDSRITRRRCPRNKLRGEIRWREIY